jgi:hypothetical protein
VNQVGKGTSVFEGPVGIGFTLVPDDPTHGIGDDGMNHGIVNGSTHIVHQLRVDMWFAKGRHHLPGMSANGQGDGEITGSYKEIIFIAIESHPKPEGFLDDAKFDQQAVGPGNPGMGR